MPSTRRSYHHGDLRRALIDAALEIVERAGPHAVTVSEAARTAGVSPGAPFHHFANKEALLKAIVEDGGRAMAELTERELSKAGSDAKAAWLAVGIAHVKFAVLYPAHFRLMSVPELAALAPSPLMEAALVSNTASLRALVKPGKPTKAQKTAARTLAARSVVHGLASMFAHGQLSRDGLTESDLERLVRALASSLNTDDD